MKWRILGSGNIDGRIIHIQIGKWEKKMIEESARKRHYIEYIASLKCGAPKNLCTKHKGPTEKESESDDDQITRKSNRDIETKE